MSDDNKLRLAHELLDEINAREDLTPEQVGVLRSFLPERPKQKTLEEICALVEKFYDDASTGRGYLPVGGAKILPQIAELHEQLKGLIDAQPTAPDLPAGMRLAEHDVYGRVVVSPSTTLDGFHMIFHLEEKHAKGAMWKYAEPDALMFIDAEPAHPVFLETEADYENAPVGTIVATAGAHPWVKLDDGAWVIAGIDERVSSFGMNTCSRRVLRWGDA